MNTDVLLTDTNRWSAPARLAICLAKVGCNVAAVCPPGHPLLKTSAVKRNFRYSGMRPLASLTAAIEATAPQIVIPCDDRGVHHLHELYEQSVRQGTASGRATAELIERSLGDHSSFPVVSARFELLDMARDEGILVPDTRLIKDSSSLDALGKELTFPWVLKADRSFGGRGVRIAKDLKQAQRYFQELKSPTRVRRAIKRLILNDDSFWLRQWWENFRPAVVAQEFIPGRPANCAVVCWQGEVLAGLGVEVLSADGVTGPATVVRVVENPEMMCAAEKIAGRLRLSGFFGLDFVLADGTGKAYLIEMNPRCTPLCHLRLGRGRDMIGALWERLSGEMLPESLPLTQNDIIAYFPQAWLSKSKLLASSFHDIPYDEPALVKELLRTSLGQSLLARVGSVLLQKSG